MTRPNKIVIAHRGASGYLPEHTLPAYAMAYALGADFVEPDLVATRDGVLICCHDIHLDRTTDVAARFPGRARADGRWYAADFSFAEIKMLAAIERMDGHGSPAFDGRFGEPARGFTVPAFVELLDLLAALNRQSGRTVGVYPETKEPAFHGDEGLALEAPLLAMLAGYGYAGRDAPVFIQSFSPVNLRRMRDDLGCDLPIIELIAHAPEQAERVTPAGLDAIAEYADGIGPDKLLVGASNGRLVVDAHARGLCVHPFTFRADELGAGYPDLAAELMAYYFDYGVDGVFTDFCDIAAELIHPERSQCLRPPSKLSASGGV